MMRFYLLCNWAAYTCVTLTKNYCRYKDLARDIVRCIVKRKAKYHKYEGPPPLESLEDFVHFCKVIEPQ